MAKKKKNNENEHDTIGTKALLLKLCHSVTSVLSEATHHEINFSPMVQKIGKTCLKPDIGCFVLFDGAFSGLVVINFTADAAMEVYSNYRINMGIPKEDLATVYTSDEVGNVMGELMNQILGDFTSKVSKELHTSITQSQPKMLTLNRQVRISVNANLDKPSAHRVSFYTEKNNIFYMEMAMDKTKFLQMDSFVPELDVNPDKILEEQQNKSTNTNKPPEVEESVTDTDDLLASLGI
jgi:CheY-specific phosphatase CheX